MLKTKTVVACNLCLAESDAFDNISGTNLRRALRDIGWKCQDSRDFCPDCVTNSAHLISAMVSRLKKGKENR